MIQLTQALAALAEHTGFVSKESSVQPKIIAPPERAVMARLLLEKLAQMPPTKNVLLKLLTSTAHVQPKRAVVARLLLEKLAQMPPTKNVLLKLLTSTAHVLVLSPQLQPRQPRRPRRPQP
jgi:hypothetical protein